MTTQFISGEAKELAAQLEFLLLDFSNTAEWRRQKAAEYPDDTRNKEAAELLGHLASTVPQVETHLLKAYLELWEDCREAELHNELLRTVGFHWRPKTATEFVREFISHATGRP